MFISIVIPTFNAEKYLEKCLRSIRKQDYPQSSYEVIIIDGGSTDKTLEIASNYQAVILKNPHKDAESGKAIGINNAKGEIIALIDSDNELVQNHWISEMIKPLVEEEDMFGVESRWLIKKDDSSLNQYFALLRIADPLARRLNPAANITEKKDYFVYELRLGETPVIGANGFLYRKSFISKIGFSDKFEEVNFVAQLVSKGFLKYAVPKRVGIYHDYASSVGDYIKKRIKIGRKFMKRKVKGQETWVDKTSKKDFFLAVLYNVSVAGPLFEAIREYRRSKNASWFWHPLISFITILTYVVVFLLFRLDQNENK